MPRLFWFIICIVTAVVLLSIGQGQVESDTLWHIKAGEYMLEHGILKTDPFSWTMRGEPWFAHEWLWEVLAASVYRLGGSTGVWLFNALWVGLFGLSVFLLLRSRCSLPRAALLYAAVLCSSSVAWHARPHVMAQGLFALWMLVVLAAWRHPRLLYLLPVIEVVWANVHGSAPLGPVILAGAWLLSGFEWRWGVLESLKPDHAVRRTLGITAVLSFAASLVNPHGVLLWWYVVAASQHPLIKEFIAEWQSPNFHHIDFWPIILFVLALFGFLLRGRKDRRLPVFETLLTGGFFVLCMQQMRHVPYFYFTAALVLASLWGKERPGNEAFPDRKTGVAAFLCGLLVLAAGYRFFPPTWMADRSGRSDFPIAAVDYLQDKGLGHSRLFNDYYWGGYLIWRNMSPFIDGRADMYAFNGDVFKDYFGFTLSNPQKRNSLGLKQNPGFYLDKYAVDAVLTHNGSSLDWYMEDRGGWREVYRDDKAVIYVRKEARR
ncbi:MAG: hypothetical protein AB1327_04375 [Bacillota bacterium]